MYRELKCNQFVDNGELPSYHADSGLFAHLVKVGETHDYALANPHA